ncbi:MAG: hypothetical protein ACTSXO_04590 [Candidatus Heimdallarchaeota archaeon]
MVFQREITSVTIGTGQHAITLGGQHTVPFLQAEKEPYLALRLSGANFLNHGKGDHTKEREQFLRTVEQCSREMEIAALNVQFIDEQQASRLLEPLLDSCPLPLIFTGPGETAKNRAIIELCSELAAERNVVLCSATLEDYKTIAATALVYQHTVVAESPIDINIAKQLSILLTEFGLPFEKILIDPLVAALGYGLEYSFSVMERIRLQGLLGDAFLALPFIGFAFNAWRTREATTDYPAWGLLEERGVLWEVTTAAALNAAGADLLIFQHPKSIALFREIWRDKKT